jgi:hypothetical protein
MGAANVGKTAFVAALLETAGQAGQLAATSAMPLQSGMPGTTLGLLPVAAFSSGGLMYGECWWVHHLTSPGQGAADAGSAPGMPEGYFFTGTSGYSQDVEPDRMALMAAGCL